MKFDFLRERIRTKLKFSLNHFTGAHERRISAAVAEFDLALAGLQSDDLAIDLGANIGAFTKRLAATGADVIAFEPDPHALALLRENTRGLTNVTIVPAAAAAQAGVVNLRHHPQFSESPDYLTTSSTIIEGRRDMTDVETFPVEVVDFVAFIRNMKRRVRILKVDIEGAEVPLMERLLDSPELAMIDKIFVETHENLYFNLAPRTRALKRRTAGRINPVINWDWM